MLESTIQDALSAGKLAGRPAAAGIGINTNSAHQLGFSCDWAGLSLAKTATNIEDSFNFNPILACLKIGVKLGVGPQLWSFLKEKLGWGWVGVSFQYFWGLGLGWGGCFRKKLGWCWV